MLNTPRSTKHCVFVGDGIVLAFSFHIVSIQRQDLFNIVHSRRAENFDIVILSVSNISSLRRSFLPGFTGTTCCRHTVFFLVLFILCLLMHSSFDGSSSSPDSVRRPPLVQHMIRRHDSSSTIAYSMSTESSDVFSFLPSSGDKGIRAYTSCSRFVTWHSIFGADCGFAQYRSSPPISDSLILPCFTAPEKGSGHKYTAADSSESHRL